MSIHMFKAVGSWSFAGGLWLSWVCSHQNERQGLLDHQELLGTKLGRKWVLQDLQR